VLALTSNFLYREEILKAQKPAIFIPTLYFASGLPYTLVVLVSVIFYKNLGESNDFVGVVTSSFYLAWVAKFLWAPLVDLVGKKRIWIVVAQLVLALTCVALALSLASSQIAILSIVLFSIMALISATQDVASDGYYLEVLDKEQQSYFVGVRNAFYKMAVLFGQGGLVMLAGWLAHQSSFGVKGGWSVAFLLCAAIFALLSIFHFFSLPQQAPRENLKDPSALTEEKSGISLSEFFTVFRTFFAQKAIIPIVLYILIFRLGDALMLKMAAPFLLDAPKVGGLGISTETVGLIYGGVGVGFLLLGGIVGGFVVSKFGLKRTLMPTAIFQNTAILLYYFMATAAPSVLLTSVCNAIEQFAYGLGTAAYTVFLLRTVNPKYKSGHYAIATALMAAGVMVPGIYSGKLQGALGYPHFFLLSFVLSIPGMITILLLPLEDK
jgi:PAT family beta-lactamase induction signal transducer AmpG